MPPIEQLLRAELKRVTDQVKPEQLRPLRVPARRHGWRVRLLPVAAGAAVVAIIAVAALLAGMTAGPRPAVPAPVTGAMPRYYITVTRSAAGLAAVVHTSADGRVTGTVKVPSLTDAAAWSVTAAGDDRSFVIAADLSQTAIAGTAEFRFFRLLVSPAAGRERRPSCRRFPPMRRCSRAWRCPQTAPCSPCPSSTAGPWPTSGPTAASRSSTSRRAAPGRGWPPATPPTGPGRLRGPVATG